MLFNSYLFIFIFLPITVLFFYVIGSAKGSRSAIAWLVLASLFFYGWWDKKYVVLLIASILANYAIGQGLQYLARHSGPSTKSKALLWFGISSNLFVLGLYKYADFLISTINNLYETSIGPFNVVLPLGISFFTFTQIAYIVDTYYGKARNKNLLDFTLFVTWFPHLIAGPIIHHKEMIPQFSKSSITIPKIENLAIGMTLFAFGLFKKVIIADSILYATPAFESAAIGAKLTFLEAWIAAISYSLQLYYDFSGYSDMAIGLSLIFNIRLPVNFLSPYKAANIIEFWRRWHITLSRFLRDYLYIPLGGNRRGPYRRYINLMVTMLLGGLWHGAGWNFVIWGGLHGIYLVINHGWIALRKSFLGSKTPRTTTGVLAGRLITFIAVVVAWVFFRSPNVSTAFSIVGGMVGLNGVSLSKSLSPYLQFLGSVGVSFDGLMPNFGNLSASAIEVVPTILVILVVTFIAPNTMELTAKYNPALEMKGPNRFLMSDNSSLKPSYIWAVAVGAIAGVAILGLSRTSEFLYFQF